ncbi:MAG TPA: acyltransferase [Humisphaera sp.]
MDRRTGTSPDRFPGLDGLRGIAILLVMWGHFAPTLTPGETAWSRWTANLLNAGWAGVDLFFVLSGFLITDLLLRAKAGRPGVDPPSAGRYFGCFFARRALRIAPLYLAVLAGVTIWLLGVGGRDTWRAWAELSPWLWTCTSNVAVAREGWAFKFDGVLLNHFWSLAIEEQFYLVWPALVYACRRRTLAHACVAALLLAPALRAYYVFEAGNGYAAFALTPCRADAFAVGGLLALAVGAGTRRLAAAGAAMMSVGGAVALAAFADQRWIDVVGRSALPVFFGGAVLVGLKTRVGLWLDNPPLRFFGRYSYGLYVLHFLLYHPLDTLFPTSLGVPLRVAGCVLASSALAWCSWHLLEKRFLKLKAAFPMSAPERPAGAIPVTS